MPGKTNCFISLFSGTLYLLPTVNCNALSDGSAQEGSDMGVTTASSKCGEVSKSSCIASLRIVVL